MDWFDLKHRLAVGGFPFLQRLMRFYVPYMVLATLLLFFLHYFPDWFNEPYELLFATIAIISALGGLLSLHYAGMVFSTRKRRSITLTIEHLLFTLLLLTLYEAAVIGYFCVRCGVNPYLCGVVCVTLGAIIPLCLFVFAYKHIENMIVDLHNRIVDGDA